MTLEELAAKLSISEPRLAAMLKESDPVKVRRQLERWYHELEDRPTYLGKRGGYTDRPQHAISCQDEEGYEPEPVPPAEIDDYRDSIQARARWRSEHEARTSKLLGAVQDVKVALDELDPTLKKAISREIFALRGRINALESKVRRRAA